MIIIHENLESEAKIIAEGIKKIFPFQIEIISSNFSEKILTPIENFEGYLIPQNKVISKELDSTKRFILLTEKDIYYAKNSKEDDWIFAYEYDELSETPIIISTARLRKEPIENFERRLEMLAIHEIGHEVVKSAHLKEAFWVNQETRYRLSLGSHCPNNSCALYEMTDIDTPPKSVGYLEIGGEKRYDSGIDEIIKRLPPGFFCDKCASSLVIHPAYFN